MINTLYLIAMTPPPAGTQQDPKAQLLSMLGMFAILGVMFYFLLIRPQSRQRKQHDAMLQAMKSGDRVLTSGGIYGIVTNVKDKAVMVKIADNVKVEVAKTAISAVVPKSGDESAGDAK